MALLWKTTANQKSDQEHRRLLALIDSLHSAVFVTDSRGRIIQHNEAARILAGGSDGLEGKSFSKVLQLYRTNDPHAQPVNIFKNTASTPHRRDLSLTGPNGNVIDLDISATQVQTDGETVEHIFVCEDISQDRSLEAQRAGFISVASHELRTPLAILEAALASALTADNSIPEHTKTLLEQAHRSARQLAGIVKDLTILAESQNDNLPVHFTRIDPAKLLEECVADFTAQARQKGITIKQHVVPKTPTVMSTEHHIREVLQNYLTNALKYSQTGTITVRAEAAENSGILFSVRDEGIGISPSDQKMLFTKFFRAEDYRTRSTGGSGLGLYLCMELAKRLDAKVWCTSTLNKGSTFYLEVPPESPAP